MAQRSVQLKVSFGPGVAEPEPGLYSIFIKRPALMGTLLVPIIFPTIGELLVSHAAIGRQKAVAEKSRIGIITFVTRRIKSRRSSISRIRIGPLPCVGPVQTQINKIAEINITNNPFETDEIGMRQTAGGININIFFYAAAEA